MRFIWYSERNTKYGKNKVACSLVNTHITIWTRKYYNLQILHAITETFVSVHLGANTVWASNTREYIKGNKVYEIGYFILG